MTQKKVYTTFFKEKAKEWLKFGYMDLTSEEDRILLLRETRKLPLEVLQGFNGVFSEILSKLREFDTLLHYLEGGYSLREEDLNYLLNVHTFPDYGFSDYSFDPDFESN